MEAILRINDDRIDTLESVMIENFESIVCPLIHRFTPSMYVREIFMPKGSLITSKIHITEHPFTISKGKVSVSIDGDDWQIYEAPYTGITKIGTRRILYIEEDCVWTTYHVNEDNCTNVEEIEDRILDKYVNKLLVKPEKEQIECHLSQPQ
jgi:hypothetical protein